MNLKESMNQLIQSCKLLYKKHNRIAPFVIGGILILLIFLISKSQDPEPTVFHTPSKINFEGGRLMDSSRDIYDRQEKIFSRKLQQMEENQKRLAETLETVTKKLEESNTSSDKEAGADEKEGGEKSSPQESEEVTFQPAPSEIRPQSVAAEPATSQSVQFGPQYLRRKRSVAKGPSIISFPVKGQPKDETLGVVLPSGSYVKAKLLTGVEANEQRDLPVLLQADYAFVGPNKTRVDLSGCFLIAKSKGNLSIERVEMQATKLSCVSKSGRMFERDVNGFVADDKDNSFAVVGRVNSKQDRVAAMAFLSSIVEGVGSAIQQAQTTNQTNALGGSSSVVTGSQAKYMIAGGASNAASMVTQWYLKQANNLLPTINIGSGQDVWIVMQESVQLPNSYFRKQKAKGEMSNVFTYLSRLTD